MDSVRNSGNNRDNHREDRGRQQPSLPRDRTPAEADAMWTEPRPPLLLPASHPAPPATNECTNHIGTGGHLSATVAVAPSASLQSANSPRATQQPPAVRRLASAQTVGASPRTQSARPGIVRKRFRLQHQDHN